MQKNLMGKALAKFSAGVVGTALLLFLSAGTWQYGQGWLLLGVLYGPMGIAGGVLLVKNPELLQKRLDAREPEKEQQLVIKLSGLMFVAGFLLAGLGRRFGWLSFPHWVSGLGAVLLLGAYGLYWEVVRENTYLSRTIQVQKEQKVVDTGLYGLVRHPMYSATVLLFLAIPLVLGSPWALLVFLTYPGIIALRIRNEEQVLEQGLAGYKEYKKKVKYRMIPYIW